MRGRLDARAAAGQAPRRVGRLGRGVVVRRRGILGRSARVRRRGTRPPRRRRRAADRRPGGASVPLYRLVAERLLAQYGLSPVNLPGGPVLRPQHELNDAVCVRRGRGPPDPRPLSSRQRHPAADCGGAARGADAARPARGDSAIRSLRHDHARHAAGSGGECRPFWRPAHRRRDRVCAEAPDRSPPRHPRDAVVDVRGVFYLFGQADVSPFYAIHDEDVLEFAYTLQAGNGPERMFSQLRRRNLLLIGCNFADWLSRFFLRLSNAERLSSDQRTKQEFLVGEETMSDRSLTVFLERFSQDTRWYAVDARRVRGRALSSLARAQPVAPRTGRAPGPARRPGWHRSSSATRATTSAPPEPCSPALQEIGGDVAWFDKSAAETGRRLGASTSARHPALLPVPAAALGEHREAQRRLLPRRMDARRPSVRAGSRGASSSSRSSSIGTTTAMPARYQLVPESFRARAFRPCARREPERRPLRRSEQRAARAPAAEGAHEYAATRAYRHRRAEPWPGLARSTKRRSDSSTAATTRPRSCVGWCGQAPLTVLFGTSGLGQDLAAAGRALPAAPPAEHPARLCPARRARPRGPLIEQVDAARCSRDQASTAWIDARPRPARVPVGAPASAAWSCGAGRTSLLTPLFVFDQFEEVFTLGAENAAADRAAAHRSRRPDREPHARRARRAHAVYDGASTMRPALDSQRYKVLAQLPRGLPARCRGLEARYAVAPAQPPAAAADVRRAGAASGARYRWPPGRRAAGPAPSSGSWPPPRTRRRARSGPQSCATSRLSRRSSAWSAMG